LEDEGEIPEGADPRVLWVGRTLGPLFWNDSEVTVDDVCVTRHLTDIEYDGRKVTLKTDENFSAAAWMLERRFPESFARPEIQLASHNVTVHSQQVLTVSSDVLKEIEARSAPVQKEVAKGPFAAVANG
jgi:hypothetical protein